MSKTPPGLEPFSSTELRAGIAAVEERLRLNRALLARLQREIPRLESSLGKLREDLRDAVADELLPAHERTRPIAETQRATRGGN